MNNINWVVQRYNANTSGWSSDWQLRLTLTWDAVDGADEYIVYYDGQQYDCPTTDPSVVLNLATFIDNTWDTIRIVANAAGIELDSATVNVGYFLPEWYSEPTGDNTNGVTLEFITKDVDFPLVIERAVGNDWSRIGTATQNAEILVFQDVNPTPNANNYYRAFYETEHYTDTNVEYLEGTATVAELQLPPSDITLSNNTLSYEAASYGSAIGELSASDPNQYDYCDLSLPDGLGDNELFELLNGNYLYPITTPINAGNYSVIVRATDSTNKTLDKTFTIVISQSPLNAPSCQVEPETTTILTSWSEIENATGYECEISEDGENWSEPVAVTDSEFEFENLESETSYYVRVRATNDNGNYSASDWSPVVSCTTLKPPVAPTDILLSNNTIDYESTATGEVIGYLSATDPNEGDSVSFSLLDQQDDNHYFAIDENSLVIAEGNLDARQYTVTIRATDSTGLTFDKTFLINVIPTSLVPPAPWLSPTSDGFILTWSESNSPCSYEVQYSPDGVTWSESRICSEPRFELFGLDHEETAYFRVRFIASDGNHSDSEWSDIISGVTLGPPPAPNATAISQHVILITWPTDIGPIRLERALADTDDWTTLATDYTGSFFTDVTALPKVRYLYRIASGTCYSPPDIAWLSAITHYSFVAECYESELLPDLWDVVTELTV